MKTAATLFLLPVAFFFASCAAVTAKHGPVKTEERTVTTFSRIHARNAMEIDFTTGDAASVTIEAPDDVIGNVITKVSNGTLDIFIDGEVHDLHQPVKVHIKNPSLEAAEISGACSFDLGAPLNGKNFHLDLKGASSFHGMVYLQELNVELHGASFAEIGGMTNRFTLDAAGASTLNASKLSSVITQATAAGASNAILNVDSSLNVKASGASSVTYKGHPKVMEKETSGASSVNAE